MSHLPTLLRQRSGCVRSRVQGLPTAAVFTIIVATVVAACVGSATLASAPSSGPVASQPASIGATHAVARPVTSANAVGTAGASPSPSDVPGVSTVESACAGYTLRATYRTDALSENPPAEPLPVLTVTGPGGATASSWTADYFDQSASFAWCRDIDADGTPELAFSTFSGGAHCCFTFVVLHLGPTPREMLHVDLLDTGRLAPQQLDGTPALELVALDYRLRYMGGSFASTSPFPRVFALRDGVYVDAPRSFAPFLLADRTKAAAEIRMQSAQYGLTPMARRSLQWEVKRVERASAKPSETVAPTRRRDPRLRALG